MYSPRLFVGLLTLLVVVRGGYSPQLAKQMAYMSSISYQSIATINAWSCADCLQYPLTSIVGFNDNSGSLQGFTGYSAGTGIIVAFRGSSNVANWITNIDANKIAYPDCDGCMAHKGFYSSWLDIRAKVFEQVRILRILRSSEPIYVTGHSLGGALAALASVQIQSTFRVVKSVITFGEPRIGNEALANYVSAKIESIRVVHYSDIVPHIPWESSGFLHQGTEIWYDKGMVNYQVCGGQESNACSNGMAFYQYGTGDHKIATYVTLPATSYEYGTKLVKATFQKILGWFTGKQEEQQLTIAATTQ